MIEQQFISLQHCASNSYEMIMHIKLSASSSGAVVLFLLFLNHVNIIEIFLTSHFFLQLTFYFLGGKMDYLSSFELWSIAAWKKKSI